MLKKINKRKYGRVLNWARKIVPYLVILSWYALIEALGLNVSALSRATAALDFPTCCL
jgi:hypothetical protein